MTQPKKPERTESRRALLGVLIVAAIIAIGVVVISLDAIMTVRVRMVDVRAVLPDTDGLVPGAEVWIAGHAVGEVVAVNLRPPRPGEQIDRVLVTARIPAERASLLRADSRARLASARMLGPVVLELTPGSPAARAIAEGDIIAAEAVPEGVAIAMDAARGLLGRLDIVMTEAGSITDLYRTRAPHIEAVRRSAALAMAELERTRTAFEAGPLSSLGEMELSERIGRVRARTAEVQAGLARYRSGELGESTESLRDAIESLRGEVAALDSAASTPRGFIGRVRADSALQRATAGASAQADSLAREATSNPLMFF